MSKEKKPQTQVAKKSKAQSGAQASRVTKKTTTEPRKKDKKSGEVKKTGLIVGGVAAGVVGVTAVVLGCVFLPQMFGTNYGESYRVAVALRGQLENLYINTKSNCREVADSIDDEDVSVDDFAKMTESCRADLVTARGTMEELGKSSGIKKDEELKKKYDEFVTVAGKTMPADEQMDKEFKIYRAVHEFIVCSDEVEVEDLDEATVKEIAGILINSGDDELKKMGEGFEEHTLKLVDIYKKFEQADVSNTREYYRLYNEFSDALDEYQDWTRESDDALSNDDWMLTRGNVNATVDDFENLYDAVRETYEEHYDGKNEEKCTKASDGKGICD